jgi:hypothetical protein
MIVEGTGLVGERRRHERHGVEAACPVIVCATEDCGSLKRSHETGSSASQHGTFTLPRQKFRGWGTYSNSTQVTSHSMPFNGSRGVTYEYRVQSTDAAGHTDIEGPFYHQN